MAELIEAAVRCGEHRLAERALERLAETTSAAGTDWALGIQARSRAPRRRRRAPGTARVNPVAWLTALAASVQSQLTQDATPAVVVGA
jgi:hypothetical protein